MLSALDGLSLDLFVMFSTVPLGFGDQKESLASFAANAEANAVAMEPSPEEKAARVRAAELEAARVARQAEVDGVRYVSRGSGGGIKTTTTEDRLLLKPSWKELNCVEVC